MIGLADIQRLFTAAIDGSADSADMERLQPLLAPGSGLAPAQRVGVYRDSSRRAREKALESIYPVCMQVLGPRCFFGLASDYVTACPSMAGDLNVFGADFPAHLEAQVQARQALAGFPYLADLARLEWHWHAVYYAPDEAAFDTVRFSALAGEGRAEQARFRLSAALRLLASDFPISEIWRRHRDGRDTSAVSMGEGDRLAIHRVGFRARVEAVEPEVFRLLSALARGTTLGVLAADGLPVEQLPRLVAAGWVADFAVGEAG